MGKHKTGPVYVALDAQGLPYAKRSETAGVIEAMWNGGAYVELGFGGYPAVEVINVYDYATGTYDARVYTAEGLRYIVREWARQTQAEWPGYYESYVENSRY